jgi:DNA repair protein RecO (recombination protein O)
VRHQDSHAFILATYPLREKDRIVSFLTRETGKKRGVARGARSPKSGFAGTLEPMTEARVLYFEKEGQELVSIRSIDPLRPSFPLSARLEGALLLSMLAESLQTFVSDSDPAEPFYRLARHAMNALFAGGAPDAVAAYFDVWILKLSGLFPSPSECAGCGRPLSPDEPVLFDEGRPGFVGVECRRADLPSPAEAGYAKAGTLRLTPAARATLRAILTAPLDPKAAPPGLGEISAVARRARRHFLGHELKSQRVLEEVWRTVGSR